MPSRKIRIGQLVQLAPAISRNVPGGTYEVTKQLPESRGEFEIPDKERQWTARACRAGKRVARRVVCLLTPPDLLQFRTGLTRL